jgi:hypothetical protein
MTDREGPVRTGPTAHVLLKAVIVALAALAACAPKNTEPVVARVGDREITASQFSARAIRMLRSGYPHPDTLGMDAKRELLADMIAQELVVYEGLQRGLDRDPTIADEVERHTITECLITSLTGLMGLTGQFR